MSSETSFDVVVIGGGTGGITAAARLLLAAPGLSVAIVEPADAHYYQPLWTLVGAGVFPREASARPMADVIPEGATWIRETAASFEPDAHTVTLGSGRRLTYQQLIVAPGIQLDWGRIEGLAGNVGKHGICSNYDWNTVESTWAQLQRFEGGDAYFTFPSTPIKCAGAPQKIMWLAEDHLRRTGRRGGARIHFATPGPRIFGVDRYARALEKLVAERDIQTHFRRDLVAVRPEKREADFRNVDDGTVETVRYDLLHVTPPMSAPDFIRKSPLADAAGWVEVDRYTTQHVRYPDVFSLGDASSMPCSKTGAAIRKQAPVLVANLLARRAGAPLEAAYDGYASCPLVTGYGRLILAEFGYDGRIMETFPFSQARERYSMYALKAYGLPELYWHGMLRGRA